MRHVSCVRVHRWSIHFLLLMIVLVKWNRVVHFARRVVHVAIVRAIRITWHSVLVVVVSVGIRGWRRVVEAVAHSVLVFRVHVLGIEVGRGTIGMRKELVSIVIVHGIVLATVRPAILGMVSAVFGIVRWRKASTTTTTTATSVHDWSGRHATITIGHLGPTVIGAILRRIVAIVVIVMMVIWRTCTRSRRLRRVAIGSIRHVRRALTCRAVLVALATIRLLRLVRFALLLLAALTLALLA